MSNESVKNELGSWFQGAYDKAKKGHSPISAIKAHCGQKDCEFYEYKPYPKKKRHRPTNTSQKPRCPTGVFAQTSNKSGRSVKRTVVIENPPEGKLRVTVAIEPEPRR